MIELSVENLHLTYGDNPVLKGVSMTLGRGEVVSLLGPSGSGKTTLLRAVAGLEKPTSGRIAIGNRTVYDGTPRSEIPAEERNLGLVFQSYALWPHKTVFDNVAYPLKLRKVAAGEIKERVQRVLDQLGLGHLGNRHPHQLSGGMRQRIVIAIALACDPELLICDEPTTALDVTIQSKILELIQEIQKKRQLSVIYITHDLGVVAKVADYVNVMYAGKIVESGTVEDVFYDPRHPYTWGLLSAMPDLGTDDERLYTIPGSPPNLLHKVTGDAFAPRNKYALNIDSRLEPPMFKISETHSAATWLLHPKAPKVDMPPELRDRIERMKKEGGIA